jgi:hypothetical protein
MNAPTIREQVISKLDTLRDDEVQWILDYIEAMESNRLPEDYDPDNDPAIGFLSGSTDLARNAKQILSDEITARSGWTQKKE